GRGRRDVRCALHRRGGARRRGGQRCERVRRALRIPAPPRLPRPTPRLTISRAFAAQAPTASRAACAAGHLAGSRGHALAPRRRNQTQVRSGSMALRPKHSIRNTLLLAVAVAGAAGRAAAQATPPAAGAIEGVVRDSVTGAPLPAARARLLETHDEDLAHADGTFHFPQLA